jgi:hypothetical protein
MRPLASDDQPRAFRPSGQIDVVGQLCHPGTVPPLATGVDRLHPRRFRQLEDRLADRFAQLVADREADAGVSAILRERVRGATDVRPDQDLSAKVLGRELREREPEHGEVIPAVFDPAFPGLRIAASASPVSSR